MTDALPMPRSGAEAPQIDAALTGGRRFLLSDLRGRWVVVYFYPRANTPG